MPFAVLGRVFLLVVRLGGLPEVDRGRNVVGVLRDRLAKRPVVKEAGFVALQVQDHVRAAVGLDRLFRRVGARAVRRPADRLVGGGRSGARAHRHAVGDDEGRVEADAELADQLARLRFVGRELREEVLRAGVGDRAEALVGFFECHADAVVGNRERARVLVGAHADAKHRIVMLIKRSLSMASDAFEMSSRRKISLLE